MQMKFRLILFILFKILDVIVFSYSLYVYNHDYLWMKDHCDYCYGSKNPTKFLLYVTFVNNLLSGLRLGIYIIVYPMQYFTLEYRKHFFFNNSFFCMTLIWCFIQVVINFIIIFLYYSNHSKIYTCGNTDIKCFNEYGSGSGLSYILFNVVFISVFILSLILAFIYDIVKETRENMEKITNSSV